MPVLLLPCRPLEIGRPFVVDTTVKGFAADRNSTTLQLVTHTSSTAPTPRNQSTWRPSATSPLRFRVTLLSTIATATHPVHLNPNHALRNCSLPVRRDRHIGSVVGVLPSTLISRRLRTPIPSSTGQFLPLRFQTNPAASEWNFRGSLPRQWRVCSLQRSRPSSDTSPLPGLLRRR